jgi:hypothetical protein
MTWLSGSDEVRDAPGIVLALMLCNVIMGQEFILAEKILNPIK